MNKMGRSMLAGLLSAVCAVTSLPVNTGTVSAAPEQTVIYETGFEDGVIDFTRRGEDETLSITTDAHTGDGALAVTTRAKSWNGPQLALSERCEAGVRYVASAWVKAAWYNDIKMSLQYNDSEGNPHYSNLASVISQGDWQEFVDIKFSFSEDVTDVYLYFECNDQADLFVDDFSLKTAPVYDIEQDIVSLKDVYEGYFKIGGAVTTDELAPQSTKDLVLKHYNSLTLGNELKPDACLSQSATLAYLEETGDDTNPQVTINSARSILNFCRDNDIPVRGHVLVWHSQTPDWFFKEGYTDDGDWVTPETMLKRMENYIKNLMELLAEEYPTVDFYAWDVVNEAWLDNGSPRTGGGQSENANYSAWVKVFGDNSFIPYAFEYARKYAPEGCKLYYNDFNEYMPDKTTAIVNMANELAADGLIDGIGMQSHLDVGFPTVSVYKKALAAFAATGLDIQVTELDITTSDISEAGLATQAQMYSDIMDCLVEYADSVSAVVFWGTTDDMSWRKSKYPLLFNEDYTAKPCFYSIVDGFEVADPELGDLNMNGSVTLVDMVKLQKYMLSVSTLSEQQYTLADMNGDGAVDIFDLGILKKVLTV